MTNKSVIGFLTSLRLRYSVSTEPDCPQPLIAAPALIPNDFANELRIQASVKSAVRIMVQYTTADRLTHSPEFLSNHM